MTACVRLCNEEDPLLTRSSKPRAPRSCCVDVERALGWESEAWIFTQSPPPRSSLSGWSLLRAISFLIRARAVTGFIMSGLRSEYEMNAGCQAELRPELYPVLLLCSFPWVVVHARADAAAGLRDPVSSGPAGLPTCRAYYTCLFGALFTVLQWLSRTLAIFIDLSSPSLCELLLFSIMQEKQNKTKTRAIKK